MKYSHIIKIKRSLLTLALVALAAACASFLGSEAKAHYEGKDEMRCKNIATDVALSAEDPTQYTVKGELCYEGRLSGKTLQLLVPGFTYDSTYWDFPYQPGHYSYVHSAVKGGYATLNIDRVGSGKSDRPADPTLLTVPSQAYAVSQIVQKLRDGHIAGTKFNKVIGAGHSLGTAIWTYAEAEYPSVDGLILAGSMHQVNLPFILTIPGKNHPANQDPKFSRLNLADGYVTSKPGERGNLFYATDMADPKVIQVDEKTKAIGSESERTTISIVRTEPYAAKKFGSIPVLIAMGEFDSLFCDPAAVGLSCASSEVVMEREAPFYSDQACLQTFVLPGAGHDTNLHRGAPELFQAVNAWADSTVGKSSRTAPPNPC